MRPRRQEDLEKKDKLGGDVGNTFTKKSHTGIPVFEMPGYSVSRHADFPEMPGIPLDPREGHPGPAGELDVFPGAAEPSDVRRAESSSPFWGAPSAGCWLEEKAHWALIDSCGNTTSPAFDRISKLRQFERYFNKYTMWTVS